MLAEIHIWIRCHQHSGAMVVTHLSLISEVLSSNPGPYLGKLIVAYQWLAVYSTLGQLYVMVSIAHKTTHRDMNCTLLKAT